MKKIEKRLCRYFFKNEKICKAFFDTKNYFLATRTDTGARPKNKNLLSGCAANFEKNCWGIRGHPNKHFLNVWLHMPCLRVCKNRKVSTHMHCLPKRKSQENPARISKQHQDVFDGFIMAIPKFL